MNICTGVVAHQARAQQARDLAETVGATYLSVDDGTLGPGANHLHVWDWLHQHHGGATHLVVLEDDAEPVDNFRDQLRQALAVAPCGIVSLYLGTGRPPHYQQRIAQAIAAADKEQAHWLITDGLLHGVGVAIRTDLVASMLDGINHERTPIDYAIRDWARRNNHSIGFTWPSLVDHRDQPTLTRHPDGAPRNQPRRAWRIGTRHQWTSRTAPIA